MLQFEYVNPLAGLAMLIIGLLLVTLGYPILGMPPIIVGIVLVVYYRKCLLQLMGA